ncbi:DUF885 domain-containing protein [Steroidobacter sp.]|uniref:DUF885 domain-containing protein n=1 Tax=Steroidobacter sp. TaxID=1978227 RepID=UPI001A585793|nr:DUF885 domain-containing protein [Steroidobacter sp.]MBL8268912.1 DUF885 domain-containing protein [Steroidobacter sp.]
MAIATTLWAGVANTAEQPTPPTNAIAARVTALADSYVAEYAKTFPEAATFSGMTLEHHDGLTDNSLAALKRWEAQEDSWAKELAKIDSAQLFGKPEWVALGFLREAVEASRQLRVCRYELWPVNQMAGWPYTTTQLAAIQPVGSEQARKEALARWGKLPRYLNNELDNLREGLRTGYSTPKANVQLVIEQIDQMLAKPVEQWPMFDPATRDESPEFKKAWAELLSKQIKPVVERYNQFLKTEYLAKAREAIAVTANKNGEQCYQASFRNYTTLDRPAKETFELGRREVERNLATALEIGKKDLQANDLPTLLQRLKQDPTNHFTSRDELLKYAQSAVSRAKGHMSKWFARVPKAEVVVEPYPDFLEKGASDSYWPAAEDGSRSAMYRITLYSYAETTRANAEITAFHEAYPGHHLQIALAVERPAAHPITRLVGNSGFVEGWARYAEGLAEEMGLYTSKYALANRRLWPARGMMIDPGIHRLGWTREQTMKFATESGRFDAETVKSLVDRVAILPGQLTAYDTGALEFFALRKQAQETLGSRFDIRELHTVLLENGSVTLPMLREHVTHWLKSKSQ